MAKEEMIKAGAALLWPICMPECKDLFLSAVQLNWFMSVFVAIP